MNCKRGEMGTVPMNVCICLEDEADESSCPKQERIGKGEVVKSFVEEQERV